MSNEEKRDEGHNHVVQYEGHQTDKSVSLTMQIGESVIATLTFALSDDPAVHHDIDVMVEGFQHIFDTGLAEYTRQRLEAAGVTLDQLDADDIRINAEAQV